MASAVDLPTQLQWYEIRDTLLGHNYVKQDVKRALALASTCQHPDARWLTEVFAGKDVKTPEEARDVFLAQGKYDDDGRAFCFAAVLVDEDEYDMIQLLRSAELGYSFAQGVVASEQLRLVMAGEKRFRLASGAASQGERLGLHALGCCYDRGIGCGRDEELAKLNFMEAARLGDVQSMGSLGGILDESDPQRWFWWGCAASRGALSTLLNALSRKNLVESFFADPALGPVVFAIGRCLRGQIDAKRGTIFGSLNFDFSCIVPAMKAVDFYSFQCAAARTAVDTWCLIARRIGNSLLNRDIRKKIGMLIWESREMTQYKES